MRKLDQKGVSAAQGAIVLVVALVAAGVTAYVLIGKGPATGVRNATATVKLHDAETIDLAQVASQYMPNIPGVTVTVSGTVTVNSFEATNVTVKLHNKTTDEWITIVEGQTITDMIQVNDLVNQISSGAYDKVSVYIGTISVNISWTQIFIDYTLDYTQMGIPAEYLPYMEAYGLPSSGSYTVSAGSFNQSVTLNQTFDIIFEHDVEVTAGENQVFECDVGAPMDFGSGFGQDMSWDMGENMSYSVQGGQMDLGRMSAYGH